MKTRALATAVALCLGYSAAAMSQTTTGAPTVPAGTGAQKALEQQCKGLTGAALEACLEKVAEQKRSPGRSGDAAARQGDRSPGGSGEAAARTGVPPGQAEKAGAGATPGGAAKGKAGSTY